LLPKLRHVCLGGRNQRPQVNNRAIRLSQ
jgi:hypothetical protein